MDDLKDFRVYVEPQGMVKAYYREGKGVALKHFRQTYLETLPKRVAREVRHARGSDVYFDLVEDDDFNDQLRYYSELTLRIAFADEKHGDIVSERTNSLTVNGEGTARILHTLELPYRKAIAGVLVHKRAKLNRLLAQAAVENGDLNDSWAYIAKRDELLHDYYAAMVEEDRKGTSEAKTDE